MFLMYYMHIKVALYRKIAKYQDNTVILQNMQSKLNNFQALSINKLTTN